MAGYCHQQFPKIGNDLKMTAVGMAQIVKATNQLAQSRVIVSEQTNEAITDFLTRLPNVAYMKFNVFRYVRSTEGNAVVSHQQAYRFTDASTERAKNFKKIRDA